MIVTIPWSTVIIAGIIYFPPKGPVANMVQSGNNLKSTWCKWSLSGSDFWNFANCQSTIPIGEFFWTTHIVSSSINTICLWFNWQFAVFTYCRLLILRKGLEKIFPRSPNIWYASLVAIEWTFSTATLLFLLLIFGNFSFLFDWVLFILAMEAITDKSRKCYCKNCRVDFCIASSKRFYSYKCYMCTCCWDFVYVKRRLYIQITYDKNQIFP